MSVSHQRQVSEHHKCFSALLHGYIPPMLAQVPPPPRSPPSIPSHGWLYLLTLRISCSTSPGLLLRLGHFLGEWILCPSGLCVETGLSLTDVPPAPCCTCRELVYARGSRHSHQTEVELDEAWEQTHSLGLIPVLLGKLQSKKHLQTLSFHPPNTNFSPCCLIGECTDSWSTVIPGRTSVYQQRSEISLLFLYLFAVHPSPELTSWCFFS